MFLRLNNCLGIVFLLVTKHYTICWTHSKWSSKFLHMLENWLIFWLDSSFPECSSTYSKVNCYLSLFPCFCSGNDFRHLYFSSVLNPFFLGFILSFIVAWFFFFSKSTVAFKNEVWQEYSFLFPLLKCLFPSLLSYLIDS